MHNTFTVSEMKEYWNSLKSAFWSCARVRGKFLIKNLIKTWNANSSLFVKNWQGVSSLHFLFYTFFRSVLQTQFWNIPTRWFYFSSYNEFSQTLTFYSHNDVISCSNRTELTYVPSKQVDNQKTLVKAREMSCQSEVLTRRRGSPNSWVYFGILS